MKKEYFKPTVKTVRIQHERAILNDSISVDTGSTGGGGHGDAKEDVDDFGW